MTEENQAQFHIHKLYTKDISFEIPAGSAAFREDWQPELNVEIDHQHKALAEAKTYEVVLRVKCTVNNQEKTAFIAEVYQAGIFTVDLEDEAQLNHTLGSFCPNLLYPYLREAVSDLVSKGGFPQLALSPINFDMLYEQQQQEAEQPSDSKTKH